MTTATPELTGSQKVAVVLMNLEQQQAARVMKQFTDAEAEEIAAEIVRMRRVESHVAEKALTEFHEIAVADRVNSRGGSDVANGLLEASFGSERAAGVMNRVAASMAGRSFEFLNTAEPSQIVSLIEGELPQTIALVLAHLRPGLASSTMAGLADSLRTDVAECIAAMGPAAPEAVRVVAGALRVRSSGVVAARSSTDVVGGIRPLLDIINQSDVATERALLAGLEERDPELAQELRDLMLTFADIVKLEQRDVQLVLRGVDPANLARAMKGASEPVAETIRANLSERNRQLLDDELANMGPVRVSQVDEARADIVRAIRDMEADGRIVLSRADDDQYVD
ncbi:MAG TPA: flagellar motor switch protein FliG [Mycetocola sp.]|jgi:flagellar motor switch protein FliG|uniref:flagellar motor switch protein FliG n=1 Tax=Mycetocola sp. TaxID=1871042 RepID=UPI00260F512B|nr:flagellar motor switch protein FliG [Mycetocola sp.]MCU1561389.1 flagellar motor switch protein FliG [Mycetocola sp.]HEV7848759.1 flagellar motor switch protein FliG [Mycetocola sp.]